MVRPENYTNVWQIVGQHLSKRTNDLYVEFHFVLTHSEKELGEAFRFNSQVQIINLKSSNLATIRHSAL